MNEEKRNLICWLAIIMSITFLLYTLICYYREYDQKIISINRHAYTIRLENGKCLGITEDFKTTNE